MLSERMSKRSTCAIFKNAVERFYNSNGVIFFIREAYLTIVNGLSGSRNRDVVGRYVEYWKTRHDVERYS
jgi:hypothetical protein